MSGLAHRLAESMGRDHLNGESDWRIFKYCAALFGDFVLGGLGLALFGLLISLFFQKGAGSDILFMSAACVVIFSIAGLFRSLIIFFWLKVKASKASQE